MNTETKIPSYGEAAKQLISNMGTGLPKEIRDVFTNDAIKLEEAYPSILKLNKGDKAPDFSLPNATGETVSLSSLLQTGKVVLTFYRGSWCPFCNLQLNQYQQVLDEIKSLGAELVAISPQTPDNSLTIIEKNGLKFEVLSDRGNVVTRQFTTVFRYCDESFDAMKKAGGDFDSFYWDDSREIPIPATFIIEQDYTISFARAISGDYRKRVEAIDIIDALKG